MCAGGSIQEPPLHHAQPAGAGLRTGLRATQAALPAACFQLGGVNVLGASLILGGSLLGKGHEATGCRLGAGPASAGLATPPPPRPVHGGGGLWAMGVGGTRRCVRRAGLRTLERAARALHSSQLQGDGWSLGALCPGESGHPRPAGPRACHLLPRSAGSSRRLPKDRDSAPDGRPSPPCPCPSSLQPREEGDLPAGRSLGGGWGAGRALLSPTQEQGARAIIFTPSGLRGTGGLRHGSETGRLREHAGHTGKGRGHRGSLRAP